MLTTSQAARLTEPAERWRYPGDGAGAQFFRVWMPYLFQRITLDKAHYRRLPKHVFLPLNRDYKPLGEPRDGWFDYAKAAETHAVVFRTAPESFEGIWHNVRDDYLWLYDDTTASRVDYFARLEHLMTRSMPLFNCRRLPA